MDHDEATRVIRTILGLQRRRATGVLEVTCESDRAQLLFAKGELVFVEHKSLGRTLGAYVIERGLLSREQYEELAAELRSLEALRPLLAFVELGVTRGFIEPEFAHGLVQGQVERNFVLMFGWPKLSVRFIAQKPRASEKARGPRFECQLEALVLQGIRRRFDAKSARQALQSRWGEFPMLVAPASEMVRTFRLRPSELTVLRQLDGKKSVAELFNQPGLERDSTGWALLALRLAGKLEWAAALGSDHPNPDSSPSNPIPEEMVARLKPGSVHLTLPTPPSMAEIEAASAFRRGAALYRKGQLQPARDLLQKATQRVNHPEYLLYGAWIDFEIAGRPDKVSSLQKLSDAARRALEHDATMAFAYFVVGHLHLKQGDLVNAELSFRRAAKLDPTDTEALEAGERLRTERHQRRD